MSKTKKIEEIVPVLDKGNYNDKRNLLYFLEQEKIASKMIEEANSFYNNFLQSKTTTFEKILKYPNIPFVSPEIHLYYKKIGIEKTKYGEHIKYYTEPSDKLAVTVCFEIDFGFSYYSDFYEDYTYLTNDYHYYIEDKYAKDSIKNFDLYKETYEKYHNFLKKLINYDTISKGENTYSIEHYVGDITIQDLIDYKIITPDTLDRNWYSFFGSSGGYNSVKRTNVGIHEILTEGYCDFTKHILGYYELNNMNVNSCEKAYEIPIIKDYVDSMIKPLSDEYKEILVCILDNVKGYKDKNTKKIFYPSYKNNILNAKFIFKKDGTIINLLTENISKTEFDEKKGLYKIVCKNLVHKEKKYSWPSDSPIIQTNFHQEFIFDVASNDLVDYKLESDSEEISRKYY